MGVKSKLLLFGDLNMKTKPYYDDVLTEEFFRINYLEKRLSFPKLKELLIKQGHKISIGTIHKYCKKLGFQTRDHSEARREWDENPLNYNVSYLTEPILEAIDGHLLGDGGINFDKRSKIETARLTCGVEHEEFCGYLINHFLPYMPTVKRYRDKNMKQGFFFCGSTKHHPDLYRQYQRWYKFRNGKMIKAVPTDVRITPLSVQMWFLGDGSLVKPEDNSTVMLRLSTDGFTKDEVEYLVLKLAEKGIKCHRNKENRIQVDAKGIPAFFNFIGRKSPVKCYNYKFDLPKWRFESKRMKEVAEELGVSYNRLSHLVKIKKISSYRLSLNGRPRFMSEHIEECRNLIKIGELY